MGLESQRKNPLLTRIGGLLADLLLLALFLVFGVAVLNIMIQVIVLAVGVWREFAPAHEFMIVEKEEGRVTRDTVDLLLAVLGAAVAGAVYWGYMQLRRKFLHYFVDSGFEIFVSKRYLLAREGGRLVSLISIVSVLGVAVGTMALIVVISVMNGFDRMLVQKFMGVFSHIEVMPSPMLDPEGQGMPQSIWEPLMHQIEQNPRVVAVAPIVNHFTVIQPGIGAGARKEPAMFRGIDPEREGKVTEFMNYVTEGDAVPQHLQVVMGSILAQRLGLRPGDRIVVIGKVVATANNTRPKTLQMEIAGIFESGLYDVDDKFVYTTMETVQDLLVMDDEASSLHLKVDDPERVEEIGYALRAQLPRGFTVRTWQQINPMFFEALWIEKVAMFIILLLIVLVAALNIIGTLVMTVVQKTHDIGILKSMGASGGSILRIFLAHGFFIGLVGTSLGTVWGLRLCRFVEVDIDKIFELPPGVYGLDRLPVVVEPGVIAFMAGSALTICILAAIIPAYQASRLNPVEALRYDA